MSAIRENWRIGMLIVFLITSGALVFVPGIGASSGPTNLQYGLDLDGGARVRATPVGLTAEDVSIGSTQPGQIESQLASDLNVDGIDVNVRLQSNTSATIEVFSRNVTRASFAEAISNTGASVSPDKIRDGVTTQTRQRLVETLQQKISEFGLSGGSVSTVGENFIVVEVPGANTSQVEQRISSRGVVKIVAEAKYANGTTVNKTVLYGDDFTSIGQPVQRDGGSWGVPVNVKDSAAPEFASSLNELGFTSGNGPENCARTGSGGRGNESYCLLNMLNGEVIRSNSLGDGGPGQTGLATGIRTGEWVKDPGFTIGAPNLTTAQELRVSLQVGALPTDVDIQTSSYISPSLAQEFKLYALITGLIAWLGVSAMVFLRYNSIRVAVPMLFTAIAEVFILLGFAAGVGLALNLSHIAGLIAVIGTGVDDLVIIADEILQQGEVATGRVFQSRFRKAFWVIGAAAATTIIAMSPLAVLSLGDLQGFAIVTIAGVLIGVLITRPAYGDILRNLVLED